jgi:hypothetical protein
MRLFCGEGFGGQHTQRAFLWYRRVSRRQFARQGMRRLGGFSSRGCSVMTEWFTFYAQEGGQRRHRTVPFGRCAAQYQ